MSPTPTPGPPAGAPTAAPPVAASVTPPRGQARVAGAVLLVALLAALVAAEVLPDLTAPTFLSGMVGNEGRLVGAALLYLLAAGTSVGVALALYPVLRPVRATLALSAVVLRTIEAVMYIVALVLVLALAPLGDRLAAGEVDSATAQALGHTLLDLRDLANVTGVVAFSAGASIYYVLLLRSGLLPRWLSGWGAIGAVLMLAACTASLATGDPVTGYTALIVPIALQEAVLGVWLLVRGFRPAGPNRQVTVGTENP